MANSDKEKIEIDTWLKSKGIKESIAKLARNQYLAPKCAGTLLELLKSPWSPQMRATIAQAVFDRGPSPAQKRETMRIVLASLKECPEKDGKGMTALAHVVYGIALLKGYLVNNIDASFVHDVGKMLFDGQYGKSREALTHALRQIGNADAISYLEKAAADPQMASYALTALRHLREDARTLALCEKALKIPDVSNKDEIAKTRGWIQSHIGFEAGKSQVDDWLRKNGIKYTHAQLYDKPSLCPDCAPKMLELLKQPLRADVFIIVAEMLFRRKHDASLKRKAVDVIMARIKKFDEDKDGSLSMLISNELADNIEKDRVHEIGKMMFDKRYGELRGDFTMVLCKIGGKDAISYLQKGAKDPEIASLSLYVLARMKAQGTLELCEKALKDPKIYHKNAIKETYEKLKRRAAKKPAGPSHATDKSMPKGLEEWSANLDIPQVSKVMRCVAKCVDSGIGKAEIAEVRATADELDVDQDARLKFDVKFGGKDAAIWIEVFMDDENAPDLYFFGPKGLIEKIDAATESLIE